MIKTKIEGKDYSQLYSTKILGYIQKKLFSSTDRCINRIVKAYLSMKGAQKTDAFCSSLQKQNKEQGNAIWQIDLESEKKALEDLKERKVLSKQGWLKIQATRIRFAIHLIFDGIAAFVQLLLLAPLRALLQNFRADFVYLEAKNSVDPEKLFKKSSGLKVKTYNVALSETNIMNTVNGLSSSESRVKEALEVALKDSPDLLCLQEAFHPELMYQVMQRLQKEGYHVLLAGKPKNTFSISSGLMIASRYPIKDWAFRPFEKPLGESKHANKGVLAAALDLGEGRTIAVSNIHGINNIPLSGDEQVNCYSKYFSNTQKFIDAFAKKHKSSDTILCGDFNISKYKALSEKEHITIQAPENEAFKVITEQGYVDLNRAKKSPNCKAWMSNETGEKGGTFLSTSALTSRFSKELIVARVLKRCPNIKFSRAQLIALLSFPQKRKKKQKVALTPWQIQVMKEEMNRLQSGMYRKPEVLDHVLLKQKQSGLYSSQKYSYKVGVPVSGFKLVGDHCYVQVTLEKKGKDPFAQVIEEMQVKLAS